MIVDNVTISGFCVAAVSFAGNVVFPTTSDDVTCAVVDHRYKDTSGLEDVYSKLVKREACQGSE